MASDRKRGKGKPLPSPLDNFLASIGEETFDDWTPKQRLFVLSYIRHYNGARAIREAGYNSVGFSNQSSIAGQLLRIPRIKRFVEEKRKEQEQRLMSSADRVIEELASVAFTKITDLIEIEESEAVPGRFAIKQALNNADPAALAAIRELEIEDVIVADVVVGQRVKIKLHPKTSALDTLAKHYKLIGSDIDMSVSFDLGDRLQEAKRKLREARRLEEGTDGDESAG